MEKMKPASRKPHRKTRTGCKTCKQRKIKCDEERPQCTNCVKHSVPCDYLTPATSNSASPTSLSQPPTPSTSTPRDVPNHGPSPLQHQLASSHPPNLNMLDLELLHNFCTSTCLTFNQQTNLKHVWKITVPQLGFQYDFVMRGILAISALHIAHMVPDKSSYYMSQALIQHQTGLQTATTMLPQIDDENCEAVWIFATLTLFFSLATARQSNEFLMVGASIGGGWLELIKGSYAILSSSHHKLIAGSLGPTFHIGKIRAELREQLSYNFPIDQDPTQELRTQMTYSKLKPESYDVCMHAIEELRKSFALHYSSESKATDEFGDTFMWLFFVNDGYLDLIREHCQEAVAIFAYFCVLLKALDNQWWIQGSSIHLIEQIWNSLDEHHRLWIRWPIEEIGWIPPSSVKRFEQANRSSQVENPSTPSVVPSAYMSPPAPPT